MVVYFFFCSQHPYLHLQNCTHDSDIKDQELQKMLHKHFPRHHVKLISIQSSPKLLLTAEYYTATFLDINIFSCSFILLWLYCAIKRR